MTTPQCCAAAHQRPARSAGAGWAEAGPGAPLRSPGVPAGIATPGPCGKKKKKRPALALLLFPLLKQVKRDRSELLIAPRACSDLLKVSKGEQEVRRTARDHPWGEGTGRAGRAGAGRSGRAGVGCAEQRRSLCGRARSSRGRTGPGRASRDARQREAGGGGSCGGHPAHPPSRPVAPTPPRPWAPSLVPVSPGTRPVWPRPAAPRVQSRLRG